MLKISSNHDGRPTMRRYVDAAITALVALGVLAFVVGLFRGKSQLLSINAEMPSVPSEPILIDDSMAKGSPTARVGLVEFSDFQCPFCARFALETMPRLTTDFIDTGKVRFGFRHLPLDSIHSKAMMAAAASSCAARQGKFWLAHDVLFANRENLDQEDPVLLVRGVGLDGPDYAECVNGEGKALASRDAAFARSIGLTGTPVFYVGRLNAAGRLQATQVIPGNQTFEVFAAVLSNLLAGSEQ